MTSPMDLQVVVDCADPHTLADWWAETLGWRVEPQDEAFIQQMIDRGLADESDTVVRRGARVWRTGSAVVPPEPGSGRPRLLFQAVPEGKVVKNRVHVDLRPADGTDLDALRSSLLERGATKVGEGRQGPHEWWVLTDPEGNEFCV